MTSKIPHISLVEFLPVDSMYKGDTCYIVFNFTDGDGDIGNDTNSGVYLFDSRFDTAGYVKNLFPTISPASIENPADGLSGTCYFTPYPEPVPRADTIHATKGDTLYYKFYITDRAGHHSDTITTAQLIIRP